MVKKIIKPIPVASHGIPKWWELPLKMDDFIFLEREGLYYARHREWKETILIGPYESRDDLSKVMTAYVKETKKNRFYRKIPKNFKTLVLPEKVEFNTI